MSEFKVCQITKEKIDSVSDMLAPEVVNAISKGLPATALAVVENDCVVGALGGAIDTDAFEIVSIYVVPMARRKGAGTALMKKLFELVESMDISVRAQYTPIDSDGRTIEPFLESLDFRKDRVIFPAYCFGTMDQYFIESTALKGSMAQIISFKEAPEKLIRKATDKRDENGMIADIDVFLDIIDKDLSLLAVENGEIKACVMTERIGEDVIEMTPVWSYQIDERDMKLMISFIFDDIKKSCALETSIIIPVLDLETLSIINGISKSSTVASLSFVKNSFVEI